MRRLLRHHGQEAGGAEIELSLLFADVRGSTSLAEKIPAQEFSQDSSPAFTDVPREWSNKWDGIVDKFVGDEVVALFVPGFAGEDHASRAVEAARELVRETGSDGPEPWVPIGAGVHTGVAYVGRRRRGRRM